MRLNDGSGEPAPKEKPLEIAISGAHFYPTKKPSMAQPAPMPVPSPETPQVAPPPVNTIQTPPPVVPSVSQELNNEHQDFEKELALGKITPETYQSLFAKKDTPGKIGTLFGLLVSGAGSGLAHQPNAVMEMMNKEVANDLDAQKASNVNAQNWYQLTQKHELQKAEIAKMMAEEGLIRGQTAAIPSQIGKTQAETGLIQGQTSAIPSQIEKTKAETGLTKGQTSMIPSQIKKIKSEASLNNVEAAIKNNTLAATRTTGAAWQTLVDLTNKMPEGPTKERAKQTLGMMYPQYQQLITDKNAQAEGMINYARMMAGMSNPQGSGASTVDYGKMNQLQKMGEAKIPGGMSGQDIGNATKEASDVETINAMKKSFINSFDALDKMALAGQLSPNQRKAYINVLGATLAKQSAGRYNEAEANSLVEGMFPQVGDWPRTRQIKRQKGIEYFDNQMAGTPTLERFGLKGQMGGGQEPPSSNGNEDQTSTNKTTKSAAPKKVSKSSGSSFQLKEGATGVDKRNGKPVIYKNGKWIYKK